MPTDIDLDNSVIRTNIKTATYIIVTVVTMSVGAVIFGLNSKNEIITAVRENQAQMNQMAKEFEIKTSSLSRENADLKDRVNRLEGQLFVDNRQRDFKAKRNEKSDR